MRGKDRFREEQRREGRESGQHPPKGMSNEDAARDRLPKSKHKNQQTPRLTDAFRSWKRKGLGAICGL